MNLFKFRGIFLSLFFVVSLTSLPAFSADYQYNEDFSNSLYCDKINTTAFWDSTSGKLRLRKFELTDVGTGSITGNARDVAVSGDYAYVACYEGGLRIFDISDQASPTNIRHVSLTGNACSVEIAGNYAYVGDYTAGLQVIDISDPGNASVVGGYNYGGNAKGLDISGNYLYLANYTSVLVIDITDPLNPTLEGSHATPSSEYSLDVAVSGDYAFVAESQSGLRVYDISDPSNPTTTTNINTGYSRKISIRGNLAYMADRSGTGGFCIVDISDPLSPSVIKTVTSSSGAAYGIDVSGHYVYLATHSGDYLEMYDVEDPVNPILLDRIQLSDGAINVDAVGEYAFVADGPTGLKVIKVADYLEEPLSADRHDTSGRARRMCISGNLAFIADIHSGLQILDISDPFNIAAIKEFPLSDQAWDVDVSGNYAYVADYDGGLKVVDISNPANPSVEATIATSNHTNAVKISGNYAYVCEYWDKLRVIDISDPTAPSVVADLDTITSVAGAFWDIDISGDYAFATNTEQNTDVDGLIVIDISDPEHPDSVNSFDPSNDYSGAHGIEISGDYAFITHNEAGLKVVDISDPMNPSLAGSSDIPEKATNVRVCGDKAFVSDYNLGILVFDISTPTAPAILDTIPTQGIGYDVDVSGDYVFVSDWDGIMATQVFQRRFDLDNNFARSEIINNSTTAIDSVRIVTSQSDSITWELSSDNGTNWQEVDPDGNWQRINNPGPNLLWRSTLEYTGGSTGPECENLEITYNHDPFTPDPEIKFSNAVQFSSGNTPNSVTGADFDGDGNIDLAVTNHLPDAISILLGNGDGTFNYDDSYPSGDGAQIITNADLDDDGDIDLAVADKWAEVSIFLGEGDGTFAPSVSYEAGSFCHDIISGDFDNDGDIDLAASNANHDSVSILLGEGDGTFGLPVKFHSEDSPRDMACADFDGDGYLDMAVTNALSDNVSIFSGNGDGTFTYLQAHGMGEGPLAIESGDFDGDGDPDLAVANTNSNDISLLSGNGDGTFTHLANYDVGERPRSIRSYDFDSDGALDLAVANSDSDNLTIFPGNGDGSFSPAAIYITGSYPRSITGNDFDGDGDIDLATANYLSDNVSVLLNLSESTDNTPPDVWITSGPAEGDYITQNSTDICWDATDNSDPPESLDFSWQLDGGGFSSWSSDKCTTLDNLSEGQHLFEARAQDSKGNTGSVQRNFTVDLNPPETQVTTGPQDGGWLNSTTATFEWSGTDNVDSTDDLSFSYKLNQDSWSDYAGVSEHVYTGLSDAVNPHLFAVRAKDTAGWEDQTPDTVEFYVDTASPGTEITGGPGEGEIINVSEATVYWKGFDDQTSGDELTFLFRIDGAAYTESSDTSHTFTGLTDGDHLVEVKARDLAMNEDQSPDSLTFSVDTDPPVPLITEGPMEGEYTAQAEITFRWTATDVITDKDSLQYSYLIDNSGYSVWSKDTSVTYQSLAEGEHYFRLRVKDEFDHTGSVQRNFTVDRTPPVTQIMQGPSDGECWPSSTAGFTWAGADSLAESGDLTFSFVMDGDTLSDWGSVTAHTYTGLSQGSHTFQVKARDLAGNMDASHASATFNVGYLDLRAAELELPDSAYCGRPVDLTWTLTNQGSCGLTGTWHDRVYISDDNSMDAGDTPIGDLERTLTIAAGDSVSVNAEVTLPDNITGDYWLIAEADGNGDILEEGYENNNHVLEGPIPIQVPPHPDLVVTGISVPGEGWSGKGEYIDWTVLNQGEDTSPGSWTEYVYLSDDKVIGNDIQLSEFTYEYDLAVGSDYTHTHPVTFPEDIQGYHWIVIKTDGSGDVNEYEWDNNNEMISADSINIMPTPYPDLTVSSVEAPDTVNSNDEIEVTWTVTNDGGKATSVPAWFDRVYLSPTTDISDGELLGEFENLSYLDTTQSYCQQSVPVFIPKTTTTGDYYIIVQCDGNDNVYERNAEGNNISISDKMRVNYVEYPRPDLNVENFNSPSTGWAGNDITVSWQVKNDGNAPAEGKQLVDWVMISEDADLEDSDIHLGGIPQGDFPGEDLLEGESYSRTVNVPLPLDVSGEYYIFVLSDVRLEYDDPDPDNNFSNPGIIDIVVPPPADLKLSGVSSDVDTVEAGENMAASWTVLNDGAGPGVDPYWTDGLYLSLDDSLSENDINLKKSLHSGILEAGSDYTRNVNASIPDDIAGQYYLIACTDVDDTVDEGEDSSENALPMVTPLEIEIPYTAEQLESDLRVVNTSVSGELRSGSTVEVNWTVQNFGPDETAAAGWDDYIFLSADNVFEPGTDQLYLTDHHTGSLVINSSYSRTAELDLDNGLEGEYYLFVYTDANDHVYEPGSNDNNIRSDALMIELTPPPDLQITELSTAAELISGQSGTVQWAVRNSGEGRTGTDNWMDRLYLSEDSTLDVSSDTYLQTFLHSGALDAGNYYQQSRSIGIPSGYSGTYYILAITDAEEAVYEHGADGNNIAWEMIEIDPAEVLPLPDLVMNDIGYIDGDRDTVTYTVENIDTAGVQPGERSWTDRFYLSEDDQLDRGSDIIIASVSRVGDLPPGETYSVASEIDLPDGASGEYYIIGVVDDASHVTEENEGNNSLLQLQTIEITPPDLSVTSVSVADTLISGQPATVEWLVENQGAGPCDPDSWYDGVYLSMDKILDETDYNLGATNHNGGLEAGGSYQGSSEIEIPLGITGTCYLFIKTDRSDNVYEHFDEDNNHAYNSQGTEVVIPANDVDLTVTDIQLPSEGITGDSITINWTVSNQSENDVNGQWRDALYISSDSSWDLNDIYLDEHLQSATLQAGDHYVHSVTIATSDYLSLMESAVPGVMPGGYRAIVRTDIRNNIYESEEANNVAASLSEMTVDLSPLTMGTDYSSSVDYGQRNYYRLEVPTGHDIKLTANCASVYDEIYIYVKNDDVPDRIDYDYRLEVDPDVEQIIPGPEEGSCYMMVYGHYTPYGGSFTLLPESFLFSLVDVSPNLVDNTGFVTFELSGGHLDDASAVFLSNDSGDTLGSGDLSAMNSTLVEAVFDLTSLYIGTYDISLVNSVNDTTTLTEAIDITDGSGPVIQPSIDGPGAVRLDVANTFRVNLYNTGTSDAYHVVSGLKITLGSSYQVITGSGAEPVNISDGSEVLIYTDFIGVGEKKEFWIRTWGENDLSIEVLSVFADPETALSQEGSSVLSSWVNNVNSAFSDRVEYAGVDFDRSSFALLQAEAWKPASSETETEILEKRIVATTLEAVGELNNPEIPDQETGVTSWGLDVAEDEARDFYESSKSSDRFKHKKKNVAIRVARDPNEKLGPTAPDEENFVSQLEDLPYTIYFENVAEAGANAQKVSIIDSLDTDLDYRRFRLGEIAYGDTIITVPENRSYYNLTINIDGGYLLNISAGIDVVSGLARWDFETIDPETGLPPLDPDAGFLPPNDDTGRGEGHVYYTVRAEQDAADGTEISNSALIVFDDNEPIITNEVVNVVRRIYPDLKITSTAGYSPYSSYVEGEAVTIDATVSNLRDAGTVSPFDVSFYRGDPAAGGTLIGNPVPAAPLDGNSETVVTNSWLPDRQLGSYEIYMKVDCNNEVAEENETNNTYTLGIEVEPKTYTVEYAEDINMVSLPLEPLEEVTARSLAEQLNATQIIRLDSSGVFETFIPAQHSGDGFVIENKTGYMAVLDQQKEATFSGITHTAQMSVSKELNLISLPLKQDLPFAARDFCELLDGDKVIRYLNSTGSFDVFIPSFHAGDGFEVMGARSYLIFGRNDTTVTLEGDGWIGIQQSAPGGYMSTEVDKSLQKEQLSKGAPVFSITGSLYQEAWDEKIMLNCENYKAEAVNIRTGVHVPVDIKVGNGQFTAVFVDFGNSAAALPGDKMQLVIKSRNNSEPIGEPIEYIVTESDVESRYAVFDAVLEGLPPNITKLYQNYPNPFNPVTSIKFQVARKGKVELKVFDVTGRLIKTLVEGVREPGYHKIDWNGKNNRGQQVASGVYFYRLDTPGYNKALKLVILR